MSCIRVLHDLAASRLCLERNGETVSGTTHDGGRVTTRPIGQIQATDLTPQMDPAKAFDGAVQSARARVFFFV